MGSARLAFTIAAGVPYRGAGFLDTRFRVAPRPPEGGFTDVRGCARLCRVRRDLRREMLSSTTKISGWELDAKHGGSRVKLSNTGSVRVGHPSELAPARDYDMYIK